MNSGDHGVTVAEMIRDTAALGDPALAGDFDEARFLADFRASNADAAGYGEVALAAVQPRLALGPPGTVPSGNYGASILRIANRLDAIGSTPL